MIFESRNMGFTRQIGSFPSVSGNQLCLNVTNTVPMEQFHFDL